MGFKQVLQKLRIAITAVRALIHFLKAIISVSDEKTIRTAVEVQWHTLNTDDHAKNLAFNPALYAQNRVRLMLSNSNI